MSDNFAKNPVFKTLTSSIKSKIIDAVQLTGKALPCHVTAVFGALITVQFDLNTTFTLPTVTIPLFGPEYIRYPIKAGDLGVCIPCDARLGYTSGQGGGTSDLSPPGALEAIFFMPIGNKNWVTVDPAQVDIYAPNGVKIHDTNSGAVINLHPTSVNINVGSSVLNITGSAITCTTTTFTINAPSIVLNGQMSQGTGATSYAATLQGPLTVVNNVTAGGISLDTHHHTGVTTGGGNTGGPV